MGFRVFGQTFSRQSRLLKPVDFKRVFQKSYRSSDGFFRVLARPNGGSSHRLGMAVAKKVCPRAVDRNRIKRLVRESFRTLVAAKKSPQALDFVVLPTAQAADQSNRALVNSLDPHWQKLNKKAEYGTIKSPVPSKDT